MLKVTNIDWATEGAIQLGLAVCVQALQDYEQLVRQRRDSFIVYGVTYTKKSVVGFIESELFTLWSMELDGKQCMDAIDKRCRYDRSRNKIRKIYQ